MGRAYSGRSSGSSREERSPWMMSDAIAVPWLREDTG